MDQKNFPMLGLGLYRLRDQEELMRVIEAAWDEGYRLFDTAAMYENEVEVAQALKRLKAKRSEYFLTSKVWTTDQREGRVYEAAIESLERLDLPYLDLLLLHWPVREHLEESWQALERLHAEGKSRFIGLANALEEDVERILAVSKVKPFLNQFESHPRLPQRDLVKYCQAKGILPQAYCPIMRARLHELPLLKEIAERHGKTVAQVILRWHFQNGVATIPKSSKPERIRENFAIFDFELSEAEMRSIDALENGERVCDDPRSFRF